VVSVDANTGNIIRKENLTVYEKANTSERARRMYVLEDNHQEKNIAFNKPDDITAISSAKYKVIPYPVESPAFTRGVPTTVTDPWNAFPNTDATTYKWNSNGLIDYATSQGNNVLVSEDLKDKDNQGGKKAQSSTQTPDLNYLQAPNYNNSTISDSNQQFALTNVFYWNNILHDMLYQYGFNETAGNFQAKNLSRGGAENDYVIADGQDGGGFDNANFVTPADGSKPRMQMYLWGRPVTFPTLYGNAPSTYVGLIPAQSGELSVTAEKPAITSNVVLYKNNTSGHNACVEPSNASELSGKIAYVQRGTCTFTVKVQNAQDAGAIGVIVGDTLPLAQSVLIAMSSDDVSNKITIPNVFITRGQADKLRNLLLSDETVNVTLSSINLDGSLDNGIISHEFGHGVSNRLTGGPSNISCFTNNEQGGEGISDYIALMMTTDWSKTLITDGTKPRAIGNYAAGQDSLGTGIRIYSYSTSMSVNPWTYDSIPSLPRDGSAPEPHILGEIWCAMLWEMTWSVIEQQGSINTNFADATGTGGNSIAMNLFMTGLKLQRCKPAFMDARDAILDADTLLYGGAYSPAIWKAFAKRGLGFSADQGDRDNVKDNISAYDLPLVLPVTFGSFTAEKKGSTALLKWTTAQENNTDKFIIERSLDGKPFISLGEVKAAGASAIEQSYQFADAVPLNGNNMYRIREMDKDGKFTLSDIRTVNFADQRPAIRISPNPASNIVTISIPGNNQNLTVRLLSNTGQSINNYIMNTETLNINVSNLAAGVYNIIINGKDYASKYKLVIQ